MKNPIAIARLVVEHTTSIGTGLATTAVIKNNMRRHPNIIVRGCQYMGMFGIAGVAGEATSKYAVRQFDEIVDMIKGTPAPTKKNN